MNQDNHIFSIQSCPPYSVLSQIYDAMMSHVNYQKWAGYVESVLQFADVGPGKLLDIGCGTGCFLKEMVGRGLKGDGCDPSREMLKVARKRLPRRKFYQSALPDLSKIPPGQYNIMTCLYDTINYLMDAPTLERAFLTIFEKLSSPGVFIFDLVSETNCRQFFQDYTDNEVLDDNYAYRRESHYDRKNRVQFNRIHIYTPQGVFEELHQQRIYEFRWVKNLIHQKTAFQILGIFDNFSFEPANRKSERAHFVLLKQ